MSGGLLAASSLSITYFAPNVILITITYGILTGIAFGLSRIPAVAMQGRYFKKRHAIANGIAVVGSGSGSFLMAPIAGYLLDHYGWRGSFLIIGGIAFHMCICGALLRPIHLKGDIEDKVLLKPEKCDEESVAHKGSVNIVSPCKKPSRCSKFLSRVVSCFDLSLFRNHMFLIMMISYFFFGFGMNIPLIHVVKRALNLGVSKSQAPLLISVLGFCMMIGGLLQGFVVDLLNLSKCRCIGSVITVYGISVTVLAFTKDFIGMCVLMAVCGLARGSFAGLNSVTMRIVAGDTKFVGAYGISVAFLGAGQLIGPVLAGYLYDYTQHYTFAFFMGGLSVTSGGMLVLVGHFIWERSKAKREQEQTACEGPLDADVPNIDTQVAVGHSIGGQNTPHVELTLMSPDNRDISPECVDVSYERDST